MLVGLTVRRYLKPKHAPFRSYDEHELYAGPSGDRASAGQVGDGALRVSKLRWIAKRKWQTHEIEGNASWCRNVQYDQTSCQMEEK